VQVRFGKWKDYTACKNIADNFTDSTPTEVVFKELIKNKQLIVAVKENQVLWFIAYKTLWNEDRLIQFLRVHPEFQRKWIGSLLIKHIEDLAKQDSMYEVCSTVLKNNIPSQKLHENLWYEAKWEIDFVSGREIFYIKVLQ